MQQARITDITDKCIRDKLRRFSTKLLLKDALIKIIPYVCLSRHLLFQGEEGAKLILQKELRLITGCFISPKLMPPQKPYTLQTWNTRRCKGPSVAICIVLLMAPLTASQANNLEN